MTKDPSIHDVARLAGVSIATVSRVANGRDRVAPQTARDVAKAIAKLGYRPNARARALSRQCSDTLGLVLPGFFGDTFGRMMRGVDAQARRAGLRLIVSRAATTLGKLEETERLVSDRAADGVIVMLDQRDDDGLERLASLRAPVVVLDRNVGRHTLDNVLVDNAAAGFEATDHLIRTHGLTDLLFLGGPDTNIDTMERARGFSEARKAAGLEGEAGLFFAGSYSYDSALKATRDLLVPALGADKRHGVVAANDDLARGVVDALSDVGLSVPGDVAVVAFDDSRVAGLGRPTLSSVRAPLEDVGRAAVKMVVDRLAEPGSQPVKTILKGALVARASCGCESASN